MNLLSEIWNEWATPESIQKAGKKVGITDKGLDIDWMDQAKFERAEAIINPPSSSTPVKAGSSSTSTSCIDSPPNVRKGSAAYYKVKFEKAQEKIQNLESTPLDASTVPSVFTYDRIKPKKTTNQRITAVHGSMTAKNILNVVRENNKKNEEKEQKKKENKGKKQRECEMFLLCKDKCKCEKPNGKCAALALKQCSVCKSVLRSQCGKKACRTPDGVKPAMIKAIESKAQKNSTISVSDHTSDEEDGVFHDVDYESEVF